MKKTFVVISIVALIIVGAVSTFLILGTTHTPSSSNSNNNEDSNSNENDIPVAWIQVPLCTAEQETADLHGGEGMQMIWGICYADSNLDIVYLISDTSQVWKSEDGGSSWEMKHKGFLSNGGVSMAVHPSNEDIVFVAGSQHDFDIPPDDIADGIYRTMDGGDSWGLVKQTGFRRLGNTRGGTNFAFVGQDTVYAGTHEDGLLKSMDGGDSWTSLNVFSNEMILDLHSHPQDPSIIFVATENGLYRYTDSGLPTLENIGLGLTDTPRAVVINPNDPSLMYASVGKAGVFKSTDGGLTFNTSNNGLEDVLDWSEDGHEAAYLAMSSVDPNYMYVSFYLLGGNQPYYTHNGGNSWHQPTIMDQGNLIYGVNYETGGEFWSSPIAPSPIDKNIAITSGNANHPEITTDGGDTWTYSGNGYTGGRVNAFGWDPNDPDRFIFFLTDFGPVFTNDGGSTFSNLQVENPYNHSKTTLAGALDPTPGSKVIVTAVGNWQDQVIAVSEDEGQTWDFKAGTNDFYEYITFHPQNADIIYAGKYKSTNKGDLWNEISKKVVAMFQDDGDIVYSFEEQGDGTTILKSIDGGTTWTQPYGTLNVNSDSIMQVLIDPADENRVYVATLWQGIYIWEVDHWEQKTDANGLEKDRFGGLCVGSLAIDPNQSNIVYAGRWISFRGHANGVFQSTDYGETWNNTSLNLGPEFTAWSLSVNPHDSYIYVGSSHGTWKLSPE
ncbi:MAG: hypothetical protein SVY53_03280 [Chloroflexota bacterium]|nr:hypothetical protein [Chloroflexota bacterium]